MQAKDCGSGHDSFASGTKTDPGFGIPPGLAGADTWSSDTSGADDGDGQAGRGSLAGVENHPAAKGATDKDVVGCALSLGSEAGTIERTDGDKRAVDEERLQDRAGTVRLDDDRATTHPDNWRITEESLSVSSLGPREPQG
jgi:hypothetical protein